MGGVSGRAPHLHPIGCVRIKRRGVAKQRPTGALWAPTHRPRAIVGGVCSGAVARIPIEYRAKKPADFFAMIQGFCATHTLAVCESKAKRPTSAVREHKSRADYLSNERTVF